MRRTVSLSLITLGVWLAMAGSTDSACWWRSPGIVAQLRLTASQARELDKIHVRMMSEGARCARNAARARARADAVLMEAGLAPGLLDDAAAALADANSEGQFARMRGLYQMYAVLSPEQRRMLPHLTQTTASGSRLADAGGR